MDRIIKAGTADVSVHVYIIDSTDGTPETGVLWNTTGIDLKYRREGAAVVAITEAALATPALTDAHADGGFLEVGNGVYRLDLPDAACAAAAKHVTVFGTVTGMIVLPVEIQLVSFDPDASLATEAKQDTIDTVVDGIQTDLSNATDGLGALKALIDTLDTVADGVKAVTDALPDAGALTTIGADTARLTAARAGALTDWIDAGRLDALLDGIKAVTDALPNAGALTNISACTDRLTAARAGALTDWIDGGRLDLLLDLILADTGTDGVILKAAGLNADAANEIADALLDRADGVETSYTPRQAFRLMLSALAGLLDGAATTTVHTRDPADTKNRITATVDASGNRTAMTHDVT